MRALWINTATHEHTFASMRATYRDNLGDLQWYCPNWCLSTGFDSTYATSIDAFFYEAGAAVYALPAPITDSEPQPVRLAERNDGYGIAERHPRMNNSVGSTSSNPDNSTRVFGGGESSYR